MVENIVFVLLVIVAIGAGVWVWYMEVSGAPIVPPTAAPDSNPLPKDNTEGDKETA